MAFLSRLENKLSFLSVDHLPIYIVTTQALVYVWGMLNPEEYHLLMLLPEAVIQGREYWRLLTFLFITPLQNPIFAFFFLYLLYVYGSALETAWGSFRFTMFYGIGAIATAVVGLLFGNWDGAFYLNTSLFLAFAAMNPDFTILLFFILPVKIKWLGWFTWAWLGYTAVTSPLPVRAAIIISLANYFLFFTGTHVRQLREEMERLQHRRRFKNWGGE